jgi:hypothetical protein
MIATILPELGEVVRQMAVALAGCVPLNRDQA